MRSRTLLSYAKLYSVLLKLGTLPETERHLNTVSKIYQDTLPNPINFQPFTINLPSFNKHTVFKSLVATLSFM